MDVNDLRIATTMFSFVIFVGIVAWAFSRRNQSEFDAAAQLPFDQDQGQRPLLKDSNHE
jgi:cytochrome c oxidase cbb3-type subunit 4